MNLSIPTLLLGALLVLVQAAAALPWLLVLFGGRSRKGANEATRWFIGIALTVVAAFVASPLFFNVFQERTALENAGHVYGAILQLQLLADLFVLVFAVLLLLWPKGGAVALAAFREGIRQPMFWMLFGLAFVLMTIAPHVPYFTFGEDHIMLKELGYDTIMLFALAFGALAASMSISEEIEGRTAITLMSKPVSRRQFLLGKFAGILLASMVMVALLGTYFQGMILWKRWLDAKFEFETPITPAWVLSTVDSLSLPSDVGDMLRGILFWANLTLETLPGLALNLSQIMVLVAIAVSLATRLPMVVNVSVVLVVYFLAHLTPVLVGIGTRAQEANRGTVANMLKFMADLFDTVLPGLDLFRVNVAIVSDMPLASPEFFKYVGQVTLYGILYTAIVLLVGLILFEDRDLA